MNQYWANLKKNLLDGIQSIGEKTEEMTRIGRVQIEIITVKREIEDALIELGGQVYQKISAQESKSIEQDQNLKNLVSKIAKQEEKLNSLKEKIEQIRKEGKE